MTARHRFSVAIAALSACLTGCKSSSTVTANAADTTPPSAVWLQADVPGRPLANVVLGEGPHAAGLTATDQAQITTRADDPDGGLRALRLMVRYRRPRLGSAIQSSFQQVAATISPASPGQQASPSARVSWTLQAANLAGGGWDGGAELMAEAENFAGQISRSPVLSLCIDKAKIRVRAVPLSDDDGGHAPQVTPIQFTDALERANRAFCGTGIQFQFDATNDWAPLKSTSMNRDQTIRADGNAMASSFPKRLLVLLRWGPDASVTGNGNAYPPPGLATPPLNVSDVDQRYVALPSLYPTSGFSFLTLQNGSFMAHELGHYLGLYHTFPGWDGLSPVFPSKPASGQQADQAVVGYVRANGGTTDALDGDGLQDTPPDPGTTLFSARGQQPCINPAITVHGNVNGQPFTYTFMPDIANAMSYYDVCDQTTDPRPRDFSPAQVVRMQMALAQSPRSALLIP